MIKTWTYSDEYKILRSQILKSIDRTLKSGKIFFGNQLNNFEKEFLKINKFKYGIAVGSGTDAIYISLLSLNIGVGDEVLTVSNTAIPTVSAIRSTGAQVKFVDVGKDYLIDPSQIEKHINKKTKAIITVHLYGHSCDMDKIVKIAKKYNLKIIEDCAQAQGAKYKNKFVGSFGIISCFSFYPTKILGTYGDGGFIATKNKSLYEKVRRIRFYGIDQIRKKNFFFNKYYANEHGINSRIDEIQCSILNLKISKVNSFINKRRKLANYYIKNLKNSSLVLPKENKNCKHVFHLFVVYHPKRKKILQELNKRKIKLNINYPYPIHKMKAYKSSKKLKNTEKFSKGIFSLPLYPHIKKKKIDKVIRCLNHITSNI